MKRQKNKLWLLDAHCDTFEMRNFLGNKLNLIKSTELIDSKIRNFIRESFGEIISRNFIYDYQVTYSRLKKGNIRALFLNVGDFDLLQSSKMINAVHELAASNRDKIAICYNSKDLKDAVKSEKLSIFLAVEGPALFQGQIDLLRNWHRLGVRIMNVSHGEGTEGLTQSAAIIYHHIRDQVQKSALQISTSTEDYMLSSVRQQLYKKEKGLSVFGKLAVSEMQKLNIICDLSHANDATFWEVLEKSSVTVCATHSNCAALCNNTRNLTDEMMRALAARNGVMGLCFYGGFIDVNKPSLAKFVEHILHALTIMGPEHVGIGSDFDGTGPNAFMAITNAAHIGDLWEALDKAGVDQKTMEKIAHKNFLRLYD